MPRSLSDDFGVLKEAHEALVHSTPELLKKLTAAVAELEDPECFRTRSFPVTRLHPATGAGAGTKTYRADIDKTSGWRLIVICEDNTSKLMKLAKPGEHDEVDHLTKVVRSRNRRGTARG